MASMRKHGLGFPYPFSCASNTGAVTSLKRALSTPPLPTIVFRSLVCFQRSQSSGKESFFYWEANMSSSSALASSKEEISASSNLASSCSALLSSAFCHLPFSTNPSASGSPAKPSFRTLFDGNLRNLHASLAAALDGFVRGLGTLASENQIVVATLRLRCLLAQNQPRKFWRPNSLSMHNFAAILPGDSVAGIVVANGILNFLNIYNTLLIVRLVLTWFPNSPPAIVSPLSNICDPYLNIFRGLIPPFGGTLDLSPILAFLVLNAFTSTAAALPAELPASKASPSISSSGSDFWELTCSQKKWMRRISRSRPDNSED